MLTSLHRNLLVCTLVIGATILAVGECKAISCVVIATVTGKPGEWQAVRVSSHSQIRRDLGRVEFYGCTHSRLVTVADAPGGLHIRAWSLPRLRILGKATIPHLIVLRTIKPSLYKMVAVSAGERRFLFPAVRVGKRRWSQVLIGGGNNLTSQEVKIPHHPALWNTFAFSVTPMGVGAIVYFPRTRTGYFCRFPNFSFGKELRLPEARVKLFYIPGYGAACISRGGQLSRITNARLQPVTARPFTIGLRGIIAAKGILVHGHSRIVVLGRVRAAGSGRPISSAILVVSINSHRVVLRKAFRFRAARSLGVSRDGKTLSIIDTTACQVILYDLVGGVEHRYPLGGEGQDCSEDRVLGVWQK